MCLFISLFKIYNNKQCLWRKPTVSNASRGGCFAFLVATMIIPE